MFSEGYKSNLKTVLQCLKGVFQEEKKKKKIHVPEKVFLWKHDLLPYFHGNNDF